MLSGTSPSSGKFLLSSSLNKAIFLKISILLEDEAGFRCVLGFHSPTALWGWLQAPLSGGKAGAEESIPQEVVSSLSMEVCKPTLQGT